MKRTILILSVGIVLFLAGIKAFAQAPPPPPAPGVPPGISADQSPSQQSVHVRKGLVSLFYGVQARGTYFIKKEMGILRKGFYLNTFIIISLFSLLYGILHTLGPGHGKLIVVSFFMRDGTTTSEAFLLSVIFLTLAMVVILYYLSITTIKSREYVEHKSKRKRKMGVSSLSAPIFAYLGNISLIILGIYFMYRGDISLV